MSDADTRADAIISTGVVGAMAAAVVPVPVADAVAITAVQITMMTGLATNYGAVLSEKTIRGLVLVAAGAGAGGFFGSLLKGIPGIGTVVGIGIQVSIAGSITAALGLALKHLLKHGEEVTPENVKKTMRAKEGDAKAMAEALKDKAKAKAERDAKVRSRVNLHADKDGSLHFDLHGLPRATLTIHDEQHEEVWSKLVGASDSPLRIPRSLDGLGRCSATLDVQGTALVCEIRT